MMMTSKFLMCLVVVLALAGSVHMQGLPDLNGLTNNGLIDGIRNLPTRTQQLIASLFNGLRGLIPNIGGLGRGGETILNPIENTLKGGMGSLQGVLDGTTKALTDTTKGLQGTVNNLVPSGGR